MVSNNEKTDLAIKLALGSDLALGALAKLVPGVMPVVPDHFMQTLALLALAVGLTHVTDVIAAYVQQIKLVFVQKTNTSGKGQAVRSRPPSASAPHVAKDNVTKRSAKHLPKGRKRSRQGHRERIEL
jgi:hypothetical protein